MRLHSKLKKKEQVVSSAATLEELFAIQPNNEFTEKLTSSYLAQSFAPDKYVVLKKHITKHVNDRRTSWDIQVRQFMTKKIPNLSADEVHVRTQKSNSEEYHSLRYKTENAALNVGQSYFCEQFQRSSTSYTDGA